jgi:hypothetical protein
MMPENSHQSQSGSRAKGRLCLARRRARDRRAIRRAREHRSNPRDLASSFSKGDRSPLVPTALYTARDAAEWLRLSNWKGIYDIAETDLRRSWIGPNRGRIRFLGADLLAYLRGEKPIDLQAVMEGLQSAIITPQTLAVPAGPAKKKRLL